MTTTPATPTTTYYFDRWLQVEPQYKREMKESYEKKANGMEEELKKTVYCDIIRTQSLAVNSESNNSNNDNNKFYGISDPYRAYDNNIELYA